VQRSHQEAQAGGSSAPLRPWWLLQEEQGNEAVGAALSGALRAMCWGWVQVAALLPCALSGFAPLWQWRCRGLTSCRASARDCCTHRGSCQPAAAGCSRGAGVRMCGPAWQPRSRSSDWQQQLPRPSAAGAPTASKGVRPTRPCSVWVGKGAGAAGSADA
jgi:hypothetical protein